MWQVKETFFEQKKSTFYNFTDEQYMLDRDADF